MAAMIRHIVALFTDPILRRIDRLEVSMSAALDSLEAEVRRNRDVTASAKALLTKLVTLIEASKDDPAQVQRILDEVKLDSDDLAKAVTDNTPAGDPAPTP